MTIFSFFVNNLPRSTISLLLANCFCKCFSCCKRFPIKKMLMNVAKIKKWLQPVSIPPRQVLQGWDPYTDPFRFGTHFCRNPGLGTSDSTFRFRICILIFFLPKHYLKKPLCFCLKYLKHNTQRRKIGTVHINTVWLLFYLHRKLLPTWCRDDRRWSWPCRADRGWRSQRRPGSLPPLKGQCHTQILWSTLCILCAYGMTYITSHFL